VALRIAFDLDGVLADMLSELERYSRDLFGKEPKHALELSTSQERQLWDHIEGIDNFWQTLREIEEGAVRRLSATANDRRWEIIFITTRPLSAGATVQVQSQRWLQSKGFPLPSVYVVYGSRGKVASALDLDVVVDDRLDNCLDVIADSKARPVLFVSHESKAGLAGNAERLGIETVRTMEACLEILTKLETPPRDDWSLIERLMRTFGFSSASE
jgi:hypothetical protein